MNVMGVKRVMDMIDIMDMIDTGFLLAYARRMWWMVSWPFRMLYLFGPSVHVINTDVGSWEGRSSADVCAAMTGVEATFWATGLDADGACTVVPTGMLEAEVPCVRCEERIGHKADAFAISGLFLVAAYAAYHLFHLYAMRRIVMAPLMHAIAEGIRRRTPRPLIRLLTPGGSAYGEEGFPARAAPHRVTPNPGKEE